MFNGFPVTNTPAVQVWDFVRGASTAATRSVFLTDDCAPIQFFKTGVPSEINLYLPPSYPEGKVLTIINSPYLTTAVSIVIYASDARNTSTGVSGTGDNIYRNRPGHTLQFFYTKATLDQATGAAFVTGWNCISQGSANSSAPNSFATAGGTTLATNAFAAGGSAVASALQSSVVGGQLNTASGTASIVLGGTSNTASGQNASVVGGNNNTANALSSGILGCSASVASGTGSAIIGSSSSSTSNSNSVVLASDGATSNGGKSAAIGGAFSTTRSRANSVTFGSFFIPIGYTAGCNQLALMGAARETVDATITTLTNDNNGAATTNQLVLPNNSAYYVSGSCIATVTGGGNTKAWSFEAAIKRGANAASTAIVGAVIKNIVAADAGAATWDITLSADTTNGAFRVQVTGQAATTIRWVCKLESTEVTY